MSPGFTFPPPPPPPPPSAVSSNPNTRGQQSDRRGRWHGRGHGRARGSHFSQGYGGRQIVDWDRPDQYHGGFSRRNDAASSHRAGLQHSQKRSYGQAFPSRSQHLQPSIAAPAVPSFGTPLPTEATSKDKSTAVPVPKPKKERIFNRLGLTPRKEEHESSEEEDDADEELRLGTASRQSGHDTLQFEHKGKLMTLNTPSEIQAWIAERKKRYPTKAKIAEAVAAKNELEEENVGQNKKEHKARRGKVRSISNRKVERTECPNTSRSRSSGKPIQDNRWHVKEENSLANHQPGHRALKGGHDTTAESGSDQLGSNSEDTSSSGESDTSEDSGDAPMEQSAKVPVAALSSTPTDSSRSRHSELVCPRLRKTGRCHRRGCSYQHDNQDGALKTVSSSAKKGHEGAPRVSLYNRLLAQQLDQEDQEILEFIVSVGERGLLNGGG